MHYVYLLKSIATGRFYIGQTSDLRRRWSEHKSGKVYSTRRFAPWELVYYESYIDCAQSKMREKNLKQYGSSYTGLLKRLGYK